MPQMAPMNWTILFLIFIFLFLISMTLVFFLQLPPSSQHSNKITNPSILNLNWKW